MAGSPHVTGLSRVPELTRSRTHLLSSQLRSSSRPRAGAWGRELDAALAPGPQNRLRNGERRPLFPYRGLGDVAALGDILAVLLVGHTDPLLGNHLRGATTCPGHPSVSLARFVSGRCDRRSAPGGRAARARGLSGGALAPTTGPGRGGLRVWTLAGRGPTDDAGLSGRARRARGRCRAGRQNSLALPLWPPPGAWNVRGRKRTQRNNETVQQPVASNCFGIRCQRQHWTGPAPRKCRLRLLRKTEREGEVRSTDPSPAPPRTVKRGPKVARARVRGLFSVSLRPEVNWPRGSWPRKHKFAVSTPEETC